MCFSINVRIKLRKCGFVPKKSTFVCTCILLLCSNSKVSPRIGLRRELFAPVKGLNFQKKALSNRYVSFGTTIISAMEHFEVDGLY